ncbi:MAG: 4Fe-4S binding protein [Bacilli bacterium]|nr:4Fe-4S binding protein [Bacilli bacterium]
MKEVSNIENFLNCDYIYLPILNNSQIYYKEGDYIYKNEVLLENNENKVYSSVSGKVLGSTTINNKKYIVIDNDYKDKLKTRFGTKKYINKYSKEEFIELVDKFNLIDNFNSNSKVLIVNGIDEYIEELNYNVLLKEYTIQILDCIDALIDIMNIKKCFLAVSNNDINVVDILLNNIGTYPKIDLKLFSNSLTIGNKNILINKLTSYKNKKYPVLYLNIKDILNIYNVLKKGRKNSYTYITLTGNLIDYSKVLRVKIGTSLSDIVDYYKINNKDIIINGLLNGKKLNNTNFIIDNNIRSIFINSNEEIKENECINCGLCVNNCPVNINPKYMYFNKDNKALDYKKRCVNCGLCSYYCPSHIKLNKGCNNDTK